MSDSCWIPAQKQTPDWRRGICAPTDHWLPGPKSTAIPCAAIPCFAIPCWPPGSPVWNRASDTGQACVDGLGAGFDSGFDNGFEI